MKINIITWKQLDSFYLVFRKLLRIDKFRFELWDILANFFNWWNLVFRAYFLPKGIRIGKCFGEKRKLSARKLRKSCSFWKGTSKFQCTFTYILQKVLVTIFTETIMHLVYLPKFCIAIVSNLSRVFHSHPKRNQRQWLCKIFFFFLGGGGKQGALWSMWN